MRILLDENFPADFARYFPGQQIFTVHSLGWSGARNGELLRQAGDVCDVFVTLDRNLEFQQNIRVLPFGVVVVRAFSNRLAHLVPLASSILDAAERAVPGVVEHVGTQHFRAP
jgi:predicted nuclease of predicted toxin-antitoxin system